MDPQKSDSKKRECSPPKSDFPGRKKRKLSETESQLKIQTQTLKGISLKDDGSEATTIDRKCAPEKNIGVDTIYVEEYLSFEEAKTYLLKGNVGSGFYLTHRSNNDINEVVLIVTKVGNIETYRPNSKKCSYVAARTILSRYKKLTTEDAEFQWNRMIEMSQQMCRHIMWHNTCADGEKCEVGKIKIATKVLLSSDIESALTASNIAKKQDDVDIAVIAGPSGEYLSGESSDDDI